MCAFRVRRTLSSAGALQPRQWLQPIIKNASSSPQSKANAKIDKMHKQKGCHTLADYVAYYRSLDSDSRHISGMLSFTSDARLGTKANAHDARLRMLEEFGNEALSWSIYRIDRKRARTDQMDGQQQLDFREPAKRRKRNTQRGLI